MPEVTQLETFKGILIYLLGINFIGYILMWYDKRCAQNGLWRIKEKTLLLISLIGGSIGTLIGMLQFRHKTKHVRFKYGIPSIIVLQVLLVISLKLKMYIQLQEFIKSAFNM